MSDTFNTGVNRRRIMKLLSAAGLGVGAIQSAAGRGERPDTDRDTERANPIAYEELSPKSQRHFDTALEEGRHTIRAVDAPKDLEGVHFIQYQGETYDVFSHSNYVHVYYLKPSELANVSDSDEQHAINFQELSEAGKEAFKTAVDEGDFEADGHIPNEFRTHDLVSYEEVVYELHAVQGMAKESVMMPKTI